MMKLIREFFYLRKGEQWALIMVGILLFSSLGIRLAVNQHRHVMATTDDKFTQEAMRLKRILEDEVFLKEESFKSETKQNLSVRPEYFDPNTVPENVLQRMNIPERVRKNILSYRQAGGVFRSPADLKKIYGMDSVTFQRISDYITIARVDVLPAPIDGAIVYTANQRMAPIELNHADSSTLVSIRGVGPVFSGRILKYRKLLGGYCHVNQLWEVYGMDSVMFASLSHAIILDSTLIQMIDLNEATLNSLNSHPYLSRQQANAIIHFREYAGTICDIGELVEQGILNVESYVKIKPYLYCHCGED